MGGSLDSISKDIFGDDSHRSVLDPLDVFGGGSASLARETTEETAANTLAEQQRQFDLGQTRLTPFLEQATPAIGMQSALSGAQGPEAQRMALAGMNESPELAFQREQGRKQIESGAAATGGLGGGDRLRQLVEMDQG